MHEFEIQVIDKDTGTERWLTVSAASQEEAKEKVAKLGEIVGEARLITVASTASKPHSTDRNRRKYESDAKSALILAIIGFVICGPVTIFSWFWSANIHRNASLDFPNESIGKNEHMICTILALAWSVFAFVIIIMFIFALALPPV